MAYQVIARKWRSQTFDELIGQSHISQTLLNSLRHNRLPHALLFTGPRGTGKTSTARILAKSLRCTKTKDFVPCNACDDCLEIAESRNLDVLEIDGASNNGVEAIRELRETVGFMPSSGKHKVYIIDEVHMLTTSAFNALLKTLEEPPPHVVFIMATTEPQKIPDTILSRCQRYDFRKISTKLVAAHLSKICEAEGVRAAPEAIWAIAREGEGSMRDSQSLLDQVVSFCGGDLSLAKVTEALGLTDRTLLMKSVSTIVKGGDEATAKILECTAAIFEAGYDPLVFMKDFLEEWRHLLLAKIGGERAEAMLDLPKDEIDHLRALAETVTEEDIHMLFDMALKGTGDLYRAQDTRVVLEMILLRMSIAPKFTSLDEWAQSRAPAVEAMPIGAPSRATEPKLASASSRKSEERPAREIAAATQASPAATQAPSPAPSAAQARGSLAEKWSDFVDRVRKVNGLIAAQLDQLELLSLNGQEAKIGVSEKHQFLREQVADSAFLKKIVNYLNTFWGPGHSVKVETVDSGERLSPVQLQEKKKKDEQDELRRKIEEHPLVREAKSIFNSEIKSIRESE